MAKDPAFLFYPGDYLRDTQCLSETSQVAYDRIMCEHMRNICISQQQLNFFTKRLNDDQKEELMMVIDKTDDGFCIPWVVDSILKRRDYSESRRKNREGKSKIEKSDPKKTSITYDTHMENESEIEIENTLKSDNKINVPFNFFWNEYDKKVGLKEKVEKKWNALTDKERWAAVEYIPNYKIAQPDKKYRKDPTTFLNNKSWLDELILPVASVSKIHSTIKTFEKIQFNPDSI